MGIDCASKLSGIAIMRGDELVYSAIHNSKLPPKASDEDLSTALLKFKHNLVMLAIRYKVQKFVIELTGMTRNANTMRLLAYFESACMIAAREVGAELVRERTTTARKNVFGNGALSKIDAVAKIRDKYGMLGEDEAEAVMFALSCQGLTCA